jgi:hypothetical protein
MKNVGCWMLDVGSWMLEVGSLKIANLKLKKWKFSNYETLSAFFVCA